VVAGEKENKTETKEEQEHVLKNPISYNKSTERQTYCKCVLRQKYREKIDHIVSACPILAEQYIKRHCNSVCV
jgi:hypothetical protein